MIHDQELEIARQTLLRSFETSSSAEEKTVSGLERSGGVEGVQGCGG